MIATENCLFTRVAMRKLRHVLRSVDRTHGSLNNEVLTVREREVMRLAVKGLTNKAIAHELNVTEGTIKLHLHNIYRKLGINSRFALALLLNKRLPEPTRRADSSARWRQSG
jgi:DNA-binding NarL/FixJ family response regulator